MTSPLFDTVWSIPRHMRAVVQSQFYLSQSSIDNPSPWTGQRTPYGPFVQLFTADIKPAQAPGARRVEELRNRGDQNHGSWRDWQGFITRVRGTSGKIRLVDYYRMRPAFDERNKPTLSNWSDGTGWSDGTQWSEGAIPPFVTLDEAAKVGDDSVVLRGLPENTEEVLSPSDLMEARPNGVATNWGNLYEVVHCARTNSAGKARVYFQPGLRQNFAAGDMFVLRYPTCVMRLADKEQGIVTRSLGNVGELGMKLIEEPHFG